MRRLSAMFDGCERRWLGSINVAEALMDCGTCVFWKLHGEYGNQIDVYGLCRVQPPVVVGTLRGVETVWPTTSRHDWCGEWTPEGDEAEMLTIGHPFPVES
jgi:hypothetical protein